MKLVIPFVPNMLRPEVKQLGESLNAEFADVSASDMAYGELIAKLWQQGESFLLCEHDVVAEPRLLEEMARCTGVWNGQVLDSMWCGGFSWRYSGAVGAGETKPVKPIRHRETALFCQKFDASLLRWTPAVVSAVKVPWNRVDMALLGVLRMHGLAQPHLHEPAVRHLHQEQPSWATTMTEDDWRQVDG